MKEHTHFIPYRLSILGYYYYDTGLLNLYINNLI